MKILTTKNNSTQEILQFIASLRSKPADVKDVVSVILEQVQRDGDDALRALTKKFDGVELESFLVSREEITRAYTEVSIEFIEAIGQAKRNLEKFHSQFERKSEVVETVEGVKVWKEFRSIEKVGLYVPGGKAAYPSTVLMLAVPAVVAGCTEIVMCTPCDKQGRVAAGTLVAADLCGVSKIFKVGGAQAIAAMAYGTASIPQVYKIFGPGNQFVTTAKLLVYGEVAIDMPAGPSEVLVYTDESAKPAWIAADLLSQLEHSEDAQAILVTSSEDFCKKVLGEVEKQAVRLPRQEIIAASLKKSVAVVIGGREEAVEIINEYAPEHLEIVSEDQREIAEQIKNVGSIFLGSYSSEPLGDYATGANHTLPTSGYAKMFEPLSTTSFGKMIQVQEVSAVGIENLRRTVEVLADFEGLSAHKNAVVLRFGE